MNLPLKIGFFSEPPQYQIFLSLTLSHLLKVTKFLVKISQFKTVNNILFINFFLLNISDFSLSFI